MEKFVRQAEPADLPVMMEMLRHFYSETCYVGLIDLCDKSAADTLAMLATQPNCVLLVGVVGGEVVAMAAAVSNPHWANASHKVGQELFWWANHDVRGSGIGLMLIQSLELWAQKIGCHTFNMASTATMTPEKLKRFYERRGYIPQDVFYSKKVNHG